MARRNRLSPESVLGKKSVPVIEGQVDLFPDTDHEQGWDVAEFNCGMCDYVGHATTEAQYVRLVSGHKCAGGSDARQ